MMCADTMLAPGARFQIVAEHEERAVCLVSGAVEVAGQVGDFTASQLVVSKPGAEIILKAREQARLMLFGGEPLPEERHIQRNFVSSSPARIDQVMPDWRERRFPGVPGETEYIPLPPETRTYRDS
jgi:redox-sensitive bicupin YhaK (pirin superfamily)